METKQMVFLIGGAIALWVLGGIVGPGIGGLMKFVAILLAIGAGGARYHQGTKNIRENEKPQPFFAQPAPAKPEFRAVESGEFVSAVRDTSDQLVAVTGQFPNTMTPAPMQAFPQVPVGQFPGDTSESLLIPSDIEQDDRELADTLPPHFTVNREFTG